MNPNLTKISIPEILYLRKFFEGVAFAVSKELAVETVAYEEFLSPLLGRLLDERSPFQSLLPYPVRALNADLAECGSGDRVTIEFETNEHAKGFSGKESHVDLGIIFRRENPLFGWAIEKAILVECKRLYPGPSGRYMYNSGYDGFRPKQYAELKQTADDYGWDSVFYCLFNPCLDAFEDRSAKIIRALENRLLDNHLWWGHMSGRWHPKELYYMLEEFGPRALSLFPFAAGSHNVGDAEQAKETINETTMRRPGLKIMQLAAVKDLVESSSGVKTSRFKIAGCYRSEMGRPVRYGSLAVAPFATFIVDLFMSCIEGSTKETVRRLAAGQVAEEPSKPKGDLEGRRTVLAKHTLYITLASDLPEEVEGLVRVE